MSDIVSFLRERYDEIERTAREASQSLPWRQGDPRSPGWGQNRVYTYEDQPGFFKCEDEDQAAHIVMHNPAAVLRDIAAKRKILDLYPGDADFPDFDGGYQTGIEHVLELLALPFASHPDYDESWRPV